VVTGMKKMIVRKFSQREFFGVDIL